MKNFFKSSTSGNLSPALTSHYEAILAAVPDIIMEVDENKVYTWANQAGLEFFGEDVVGKEASNFFEGEQDTYDRVKTIFEGNENVIYLESWQRRQDGEKRLLAWWCRVLKDTDGNVKGAVSTARDITEQRQIEEQLQFQNQLFENTLESLNHPFYVIDAQDYMIKMANAATAIFGTISEGTTCYALTHNRERPCRGTKHVCPLELVKKTKKPVKLEHIHYDKDGMPVYFEIHGFPILDDDGNVVQMIEYTLDITERKKVEEALLESERRFRSITQTASDAIITINNHGEITFWNTAAERIFGYSADEIHEHPITKIIPERYRKAYERGMNQAISFGKSKIIRKPIEMIGLRKNGTEFPIELSISSWHTKDGMFFTGIVRDITQRKQMQEALKKSYDELEIRVEERTKELEQVNKALRAEIVEHKKAEKARKVAERKLETQRIITMRSDRLRSLGQMAAGIAHELNQPLVGVRGLAEHLLIGLNRGWEFTEDKLKEKFSLIIEQADRMSHIIEHVRLFARDAGKPEMRRIEVNDVIGSAMDMLGAQFHSRGIVLGSDLCREECTILANPFSLEEVILNLMLNARDAVEEKLSNSSDSITARILLCTSVEQKDAQKLVRIEVTDNGIGIKRDLLSKVFDPFFTSKEPDKGTGLGLSISKSIIEQFHGTIDIQSVYKEGTTVTIILPAAL
jgi:PAS domain S-box-containing protein